MKKNKFIFGMAILVAALFFTACSSPTNPDNGPEDYKVTVKPAEGGTIVPTPTHGPAGTLVTIRVYPTKRYELTELKDVNSTQDQQPTRKTPGEYEIRLTKNVILEATFAELSSDKYSVTIDPLPTNGFITANPQNGSEGEPITLTITPAPGYGLKEGTLKIKSDNSDDPESLEGTSKATFTMPAANVTVSAVFEKKDTTGLIAAGTDALVSGNFDNAITAFESAYEKDKANTAAIIYSSLAKLASIAKSPEVWTLMSKRLGVIGYPGTIDALLRDDDWLTYYENEGYGEPSRLPVLSVPGWFEKSGIYEDNLTNGALQASAWPLLLFANLADTDPAGLNALLDDILSSVFGVTFEDAAARVEKLKYADDPLALDKDVIQAFGLSGVFDGEDIYVGKAELDILFSAVRLFKASLEWVAAYDWNTDINFLKTTDWHEPTFDNIQSESLPLRNKFMKDRNNGRMGKSKTDFINAITDTITAYEYLISEKSKLPGVYKKEIKNYQWIKDGLSKLKTAINDNGKFYVKESSGDTYENSATNAMFGIDMKNLFTPGYLAIDKLIETESVSGKGLAPKFYGFTWNSNNPTAITKQDDFEKYDDVGFKIKFTQINTVILSGSNGSGADEEVIRMFSADIGEVIYDLYHK